METAKSLSGRRLLIVEDSGIVALSLKRTLKELGAEVVGPIGRIEAALEAASSEALDGAILDINIRGILVYPVAEKLRERLIPFVFVSGYEIGDLPEQFSDIPVLAKPYSAEILAEVFS